MTGSAARRPALALAVGIALFAMVPFLGGDYFIGVALLLLMWIALTESWVVLSAMTGYISLGHVVFFGAGAYVMVLTFGVIPFWASVLASGAAAGALALLVGYPCLRVRGPYFVILTFGLAELVKFIVINVEASLGKFGRFWMALVSKQELVLPLIASVFVVDLLTSFLQRFYYRRSGGRRLFTLAPIHHGLERYGGVFTRRETGWHEVQVVVRFWILAACGALASLALLKVR